mgnify:CR=1 FL=1
MSILVTGGAGLVGMALRQRLQADRRAVIAADVVDHGRCDSELVLASLTDEKALAELFAGRAVEAVVHCGAISGPMLAKDDPALVVEVNVGGTARLMNLARLSGVKRFVFCSSISVYGDVGPGMIDEATPLRPTSTYAATKVAGEALVDSFLAEHGLDGVSLRIARVYGPYRRGNCLIADMIRDRMAGRRTVIPCDRAFMYHYVHVDDVVSAILTALDAKKLPQRRYNVGGGEALTMPQIVELAGRVLPGARIEMVPGEDEVPDVQTDFDLSAIRRDLGWTPAISLAQGMALYRDVIEGEKAA